MTLPKPFLTPALVVAIGAVFWLFGSLPTPVAPETPEIAPIPAVRIPARPARAFEAADRQTADPDTLEPVGVTRARHHSTTETEPAEPDLPVDLDRVLRRVRIGPPGGSPSVSVQGWERLYRNRVQKQISTKGETK